MESYFVLLFHMRKIFGQHVYYNFLEKTFEFEPPILQENEVCTDQHKVLCWLYSRRFEFFKKTSLYCEFLMTYELKTATICIQGIPEKDGTEDTENTSNLCKNLFGSVVGMMLFRESLRNTYGERVFSCWRDIARWHCLEDHDPEKLSLAKKYRPDIIHSADVSTSSWPRNIDLTLLTRLTSPRAVGQ
ncbi:hypothetical protein ACJMK2_010440 [Sinanodonta woodiana]|uniref:Uncharacterized protein n=1 Tax=Sinanodonta woodiana TaxID=1069815 RepID=A0ABD3VFD5_SINWO